MLEDSVEDKKDLWLIYEVCRGKNLNECLFEVKGEFFKGERVYGVKHWPFYHCIRNNMNLMRDFIRRMCEALTLLGRLGIVHADLKPDNIVLDGSGHALLTDFGLSKEGVVDETMARSFCGSYAYLAPEML